MCCFLISFSVSLEAQLQDLRMQYFGQDQGLYSSHIIDLVQDSTGFIWVASQDGLFRYDAYGFRGYYSRETDPSSLTSSLINCLFVDAKGTLWIGTKAGLNRYDPSLDKFSRVPVPSSEQDTDWPPITHIGLDSEGRLLVSTDNEVFLSEYPAGIFRRIIFLESGQISSFLSDENNMLWIGCSENGGLRQFSGEGEAAVLSASGADLDFLCELNITNLILHRGRLWIATLGDGIIVYDPAGGGLERIPGESWEESMVAGLSADRAGNLWAYDYAGIKIYNEKTEAADAFLPVDGDPESVRPGIAGVFEDNQGNYWIYHRRNGLGISVRYKGFNSLETYSRQIFNTKDLRVSALQEDINGNLWLGMAAGGIRVYDRHSLSVKEFVNDPGDPFSLGRGDVMCIFRDSEGTMWVGTYFDGLQYYEASSGKFISFRHDPGDPHSIAGNDIRSIAEDGSGRLWMSVHGKGIDCFDPATKKFQHFNVRNSGLSNDWTFQLLFDGDGGLWAGTAWGLNYLEKGSDRFVNYLKTDTVEESLSDNFITTLHIERDGILWIGTQNGISRYNAGNNSFTSYLISNRFSYILGVLSDERGNLWISHRSGMLKMNPESGERTNYGSQDGLQTEGYSVRSVIESSTGEFVFGGNNGVDIFRPLDLRANTTPPAIVIDQVRIIDSKARVDSTGKPVYIGANPTETLTLTPSQFMITLSFKALNFISPEKNRYQTFLEGMDQDWNDQGSNREISYTNLDPGSYTFRVRGSNNDGVWSLTDAILQIRVLPAWYETWLVRIILILSVLGFIYLFFLMRTAQLRARTSLLDRMVKEKTGELQKKTDELERKTVELEDKNRELETSNKTKDKLISIIAHDLINPFNTLIGMSELMMDRIESFDSETRKRYTRLIHGSAQSAFALLQNLLAWARSQTGQIKHSPEDLDIRTIVGDVIELNRANIEAKGLQVRTEFQGKIRVWGDGEMIRTILRNLLNNAIKFVPRGGEIIFHTHTRGERVWIAVEDKGIGISAEKIGEILQSSELDPAKGTEGERGSGIGLNLCKEFIRMHGGELAVDSQVGKGTTFSFTLPTERPPSD